MLREDHEAFLRHIDETGAELSRELRRIAEMMKRNNETLDQFGLEFKRQLKDGCDRFVRDLQDLRHDLADLRENLPR